MKWWGQPSRSNSASRSHFKISMAGVYLSYPFCAQKCTYCNFASGVFPRELETRYNDALKAELAATAWPWVLDTVYLGGGTPSQMDGTVLAGLLAQIPGRPWREATMEAAPGGISDRLAHAWRGAGINRVSLGVQSFVSRELSRTGRKHTAEIVASEIAILRAAGIENFNIDLIAGLPGQTRESWNASLDWIERLQPPHVSIYMLEVDDDSRLGAEILTLGQRYGAPDVPGDDSIAEFYETAVARLAGLGIPRYEISNFARPGFESRHNLKYWRREPYLGFGADAHSFDGAARWQNAESAREYVERFASGQPFAMERTAVEGGEEFFLGLRLTEGIEADWSRFAPAVEEFQRQGLLEIDGQRLRLTPRGVMLSNEVFAEFV
jgi:oxygen-independent coproporphyrinogen III oxidase